jgi:tellurite resistance protein TerC
VDVPLWAWIAVVGVILAMLALDLLAHRRAHEVSLREAATWSAVWIALGVAFGVVVWTVYGADFGGQYFAGFVVEKSLAVDNVFIFALVFAAFAVPREYQHRVLFLGVLGALVLRAVFIAAGAAMLESFSWVLYVFGAVLLITAWRMLRSRNDHADPAQSRTARLFRRFVPTTDEYHGQALVVRKAGRLLATPLLLVLVVIEVTDVVFAVDSIPAVFAVTQEPFLVFTSNAFAILGLRALYFLLADLVDRFVYLKLGLAVVLAWVGLKLMLVEVVHVPTAVSLAVVLGVIAVAIVASLLATRERPAAPAPDATDLREFGADREAALPDSPAPPPEHDPSRILTTGEPR